MWGRSWAPLRGLLLLAIVGVAVWIRCLPLGLRGAEGPAAALARATVRERLAAPGLDPAALEARVDDWIAAHPAELAAERAAARARVRDAYRYEGADGRARPYLADYDSYLWLRHARSYLRTGTVCDAGADGACRDALANAPVGAAMRYARSLHVAAIVGLHRLLTLLQPERPLPATAFLVPVIVGALAALPAFGIGRLLAGDVGGVFAAVVATLNPLALARSVGADNDVWNLALPLFLVWAAMRALAAARPAAQAAWAAAAGLVAGLHAATWRGWVFGYGIVLAGLLAAAALRALRGADRRALRVAAVFYVAAGLAVTVLAPGSGYLAVPLRILDAAGLACMSHQVSAASADAPAPQAGAGAAASASASAWPSTLDTVAELARPGREAIAVVLGGPLYLLAGWLGLLAMLLPPRGWQWWHFVTLIAGNYLYLELITGVERSRLALVVLLGLPLAAAAVLEATVDRRRDLDEDPSGGGRLIVALWLLAALFLAYGGARFVLLLAAPFGLAVAVAVGRVYDWLARGAARLPARLAVVAHAVILATVLVALGPPLRRAYALMAPKLPEMRDVWWDTLTALRDETPPDAIVTTWWDYGHWVKYVAERRTSADGSTLLTHVPHWIARALLTASEAESRGLLRMLACGSDATPEPEGRLGAYGKLRALGLDEADAHALIVALARVERPEAEALLAAQGLTAAACADVLASTHCRPPPAYLVLTTDLLRKVSWIDLGRWDPARATPAPRLTRPLLRREWLPCAPGNGAGERRCPVTGFADDDTLDAAFVYTRAAPARGRLILRERSGGRVVQGWTPGVALLAADGALRERRDAAGDPGLAVLVDDAGNRVLLGTPDVLRSMLVRLLFLEPPYAGAFAKHDERRSYDDTRVAVWRIDWDARPRLDPAATTRD